MTPTNKLRFVERVIAVPATDGEGIAVRILQQWWENRFYKGNNWFIEGGEWRDVPVEKEIP